MTDEAREAAARSAWSKHVFSQPHRGIVNAEVSAFNAGFDAGVAEGIRQARAMVAKFAPHGDGSYEDGWERGFRRALEGALRDIDALVTT